MRTDQGYDFAKTQIAVFYVILLLSTDSLNPIKILLHVFPQISPWHVSSLSIAVMVYVFVSEMKQMLYFCVKLFFHSILSIFFRDVAIIGKQNIPIYGPVLFIGNHANQFIDSVVMLSTCQRTISFLIAEKSYNRRIIGDIAWAMGGLPVARAQDSAKTGQGTILFHDMTAEIDGIKSQRVIGRGTKFTKDINEKDKISIGGLSNQLPVLRVIDDETMDIDTSTLTSTNELPTENVPFVIFKRVDQKKVYEKVLAKFAAGGAIGVFPEGGSHDRPDLLPLKVGIALMAYSSLEKDGINVPIVPVGLNYFRGHRFRGRVTVEYGKPIYLDPSTLPDYLAGGESRRKVCNELLQRIEDSMRGVIVSVPDFKTLQMIHTARRLYRNNLRMSVSEKQDLSRRFAEGYKRLMLMTKGNPPQEWIDLQNRIRKYQKDLDELGIRDHQIPGLESEETSDTDADKIMARMRIPFRIIEFIFLLLVSAIPAIFLNLPVGLIARYWALHRREKALKASKVKVKGMDVMLSEKVLFCIVSVPSLWIFYAILLIKLTDWDIATISVALWSLPIFSYMGIVTTEAGMISFKDLKPHIMRLYPSTRRRMLALPAVRRALQEDLKNFIKKIGPSLGDVYTEKTFDWTDFQHTTLSKEKLK